MRFVVAVAEELSFTKAAARCHVSQPPLSRAIRELEEELGLKLFERDTHSVRVTLAGQALIADVRVALSALEKGVESARRTAAGLKGALKIGFGGSTVYSLMPSLVRRFRSSASDVDLEFSAMPVLSQIDALRSGVIDIGLLRLPIFDELIETRFVHSEPLVVALPEGHELLSRSGPVAMSSLRTSKFITYEPTRGFNFHSDLLALCRLSGFNPEITHQVPTTEAVVGIVACGEGVAVLPASAERLRMKGVFFRPLNAKRIPEHLSQVRFGLAWCKEGAPATALQFVERVAPLEPASALDGARAQDDARGG
ncbi:MAG: LysR family transcriptional regulator [Sphingomonadales bacterium]|nr:LysR family transcriptional regulator [Sphingomonadales bacterium]